MENTTSIAGKDGYPMVVTSGDHDRNNNSCLAELVTNNNIADNGRAILSAIANGNAAIIAADQSAHLANQKATMDASVAGINATNLNGVSNIEATNRNGLANVTSTERNGGEIRMDIAKEAGESRLASAISSSEMRELINATSTANLVAIKENGFTIRDEACKTREILAKQIWDLEKETLKGFHATQLEAQKNEAKLSAQLAKCCCENEILTLKQGTETRALILAESARKCETENVELRTRLMILSGGVLGKSVGA